MTDVDHRLKVTHLEDVVEYQMSHPGCPSYATTAVYREQHGEFAGAEAYSSTGYDCGVAMEIEAVGLFEAIGVCSRWDDDPDHLDHLAPGIYTVEHRSTTHPATPAGPEEHNSWLEVERVGDLDSDG